MARLGIYKDVRNQFAPAIEGMGLVRRNDGRTIGLPIGIGAAQAQPGIGERQRYLDRVMGMNIRGSPRMADPKTSAIPEQDATAAGKFHGFR